MAVTTFFTCVSGVFLLAGAGAPGVRVMVALIFFISLLNLSVHARELCQAIKGSRPGGVKPEPPAKSTGGPDKPAGGGPPGDSRSDQEGGNRSSAGSDGGGPKRHDQGGGRK